MKLLALLRVLLAAGLIAAASVATAAPTLRAGDTFVIRSKDHPARNSEVMQRIAKELKAKGVTVEFIKEKLTAQRVQTTRWMSLCFRCSRRLRSLNDS